MGSPKIRRECVGQGVALQVRQRAPFGIEEVTGSGIDADRDAIVDAPGIIAFSLGDDQRLIGQAEIVVGLPAQPFGHDHLAVKLAGLCRPQVLGPDTQRRLGTGAQTVCCHGDRHHLAARQDDSHALRTSVSKKFIFGEPMNPATNKLTGW